MIYALSIILSLVLLYLLWHVAPHLGRRTTNSFGPGASVPPAPVTNHFHVTVPAMSEMVKLPEGAELSGLRGTLWWTVFCKANGFNDISTEEAADIASQAVRDCFPKGEPRE